MEARRHFIVVFLLTLPYNLLVASHDDCSRCDNRAPPVRSPFKLYPDQCSYSAFDLYCNANNETILTLPFSGDFIVTNIDYKYQFLDVADPHDCISRRVLKQLNFSSSPFQRFKVKRWESDDIIRDYDLVEKNLTFINCSAEWRANDLDYSTKCLGGTGYEVYALMTEESLDHNLQLIAKGTTTLGFGSCRQIKTTPNVLMQIRDKPYKYEFFLRFSWSEVCEGCKERGIPCRLKNRNEPPFAECFNNEGLTLKLLVTGITIGTNLLLALAVVMVVHKCYNSHQFDKIEREYQLKINKFLENYEALRPTRYSYEEIKRITNEFKIMLGKGGFGSVYKGTIGNDLQVAVKILNDFKGKGEDFTNEVGTIGMIHHVNIVRLVGFCVDGIKKALVYEFMPNESLEKYIFWKDSITPSLGWEKLQEIAIGIAKGIEYLHQGCDQRILHFDIKPHNILLDQNMKPKISDFGLAKLSSKGESIVSMTATRGTIGYIAPEVFSRNFGNVSYKSDVYSFGMLVLEMVGGRKNIDNTTANSSQVYFPEWAYNHLNEYQELGIQLDIDEDRRVAKKLTIVALWCIQWYPADRPTMTAVVHMLEGETENLIMPSNPFASTDEPETSSVKMDKPSHTMLAIIPEIEESN